MVRDASEYRFHVADAINNSDVARNYLVVTNGQAEASVKVNCVYVFLLIILQNKIKINWKGRRCVVSVPH